MNAQAISTTIISPRHFNDDKWYLDDLTIPTDYSKYSYAKSITFERINNPWLKHMVKEYIISQIYRNVSITSILSKIKSFTYLDTFMEIEKFHNMQNFTHQDTLAYIRFLNSVRPSIPFLKRHISILSVFTQWGMWKYPEQFPKLPVTRISDLPKSVRKEPKYYTENEMVKIKSVLPFTDKMTARMTLIMMYHGLRFSDISRTPITIGEQSCLTETSDHQYIFEYYMSKTKRYNRIPVSKTIAEIIKIQIESTRRKYGEDCNILFATDKYKGYIYANYSLKMKNLAEKYNLTYDDGRPLRINTRLFRSTYATKLINTGVSPDAVRAVLGHRQVTTQIHYATIHGTTMISLLAPLTQKDDELIARIGHVTESMCHVPDDYSDFIPLPNGACTCAGDCPHQNACYTCSFYIPQKDFLPTYRLQLEQAELAIEEARRYNHTAFMEKNTSLRNALKSIIKKLEADTYETG